MTHKKVRIAAYGMTAIIAASSMGMDAHAVKLSDVLPSAGIGVTFSDGVTLAQMQERVLAEAQNSSDAVLSVSEMKAYLEEQKTAPLTITSASIVKTAEVQQVLAELEVQEAAEQNQQMEAVAAKEETVIASVAAASGEALSSGSVTAAQDEKGTESSSKEAASEETPAAGAEETAGENTEDNGATVSGNNAGSAGANETENTEKKTEIEGKVIESTQSIAELLAGQAATMTEEEKEFSNLVIAKVNNYVNVRSDASEESEVVGKLYDKSVGTFISEKNGWYEINSGNVTGYVKAEFCVTGKDAIELAKQVGTRIATVTTTTLKVREEASAESTVLGLVPIEEELSVVEEEEGWIKVDIEEGYGWVSTDFVSMRTDFVKAESKEEEEARLAKEEEERRKAQAAASANSEKPKSNDYNSASSYIPAGGGSASGNAVAEFALQFKGNPYVWGGTSLTNGADCSGFVMSVYKNFGVSLPHSSTADRNVGSAVGSLAEAQPGDLICYSGHVGIYIGGNQIVHASTSKTGIIVSNASYRNILAIRRIF